MKIRDHFSLAIWPPEWIAPAGDAPPPLHKREQLVLLEAERFYPPHQDPYRGYIRLTAEYGKETKTHTSMMTGKTHTSIKPGVIYIGVITVLRDPEFLEQLFEKLQTCIGQTIQEIGDAEI